MLKIDIITLFSKMFVGPLNESIMWRAQDKKFIELNIVDLRQFGITERKTVDNRPYGGGAGMILRIDVIDNCLKSIKAKPKTKDTKIVLLDAGGEKFTQKKAYEYSSLKRLILICGHYEGIDHRVHENLVDEIISIGDYVLTGGEIPAMVVADTVTRLVPGVIKEKSLKEESFSDSLEEVTEYPQYTRPEIYKNLKVPSVLLTGNHKKIDKWRKIKK
ncbi:tRNA (guanosine(37)-N1)-methyltransferase TrmD [Candidatus Woesebacteria bacterium RIFOXYC1_FULL_31_51]|uniref:tRNA (guanine-N(1)-)-methyltransferase n=1 Tax=Candidatus Woesebacteria bacterium GW2011_GWC2_31_9 TaxID=1618586 RepID=A0A0F9YIF4_9BACT|nr:MAG: tRNA (guanine-N1)-methyltransferase, tRNA (guanine37-N1)-methyltransferase [Candidatus Woesebacteria bacterium GW2011_GWF1_31_35]KKP23459.1 MAG: tRNA (guanine-N(1)-)-methyltransferase [Candidatus Woesebacteria bacterium GW2011_GWC1_30_29]KKP26436.1 MAG: tRNA (guanine-N(1)-)-methyltransferase [Candidatus Woesebacteria bacterium GW2011_GWD1_31_12]KKP27735.1 MAG: tRNA (guanine-N(1)-)-methyltransferase [Candidatus Woesebacteria bacterium GW2011_GWB1_31_29]KKP31143.1 MAG: tRNA (guanine-N(1)-